MYTTDDLYETLEELESLIRENTKTDGTASFDPDRVMIALALARRMILRDEKNE